MDDPAVCLELEKQQRLHHPARQAIGGRRTRLARCAYTQFPLTTLQALATDSSREQRLTPFSVKTGSNQRPLCPVLRGTLRRRPARSRRSAAARAHAAKDCAEGEGSQGGESAHARSTRTRGTVWRRGPACRCFDGWQPRWSPRRVRQRLGQRGRRVGSDCSWCTGATRAQHGRFGRFGGRGGGPRRGRDGGGTEGGQGAGRDEAREEEGTRARDEDEPHGYRTEGQSPRKVRPAFSSDHDCTQAGDLRSQSG